MKFYATNVVAQYVMNPNIYVEHIRNWRKNNREKYREAQAKYRKNNEEKIKQYKKEY